MTMKNDDLHRSGLAFGWLEETRPRSMARRYWTAVACLVAAVIAAVAIIAWRFQ
jgi:hypothetical protein